MRTKFERKQIRALQLLIRGCEFEESSFLDFAGKVLNRTENSTLQASSFSNDACVADCLLSQLKLESVLAAALYLPARWEVKSNGLLRRIQPLLHRESAETLNRRSVALLLLLIQG